jgi:hypothetical protein
VMIGCPLCNIEMPAKPPTNAVARPQQ